MASAEPVQPVRRPGVPPPAKGKAPPPPKFGGPKAKAAPKAAFTGTKLRPLFWTAVAQPPPQSVWQDLVEPASFNLSFLEKNFALTTTSKPNARKGEEAPEKVKRHRVLDDRTSQLLAIAFRKLPPPDRLAAVVDDLEDFPQSLPAEAVIALSEATQQHQDAVEQIRQLKFTDSDLGQLDLPERYLWVLGKVPFCTAKLACGSLLVGSACELPELRRAGEKVGVCCQALRKSELLQKFASTALAVGNVLNRGTARSAVKALTLPDALLKLEELRTSPSSSDEGPAGRSETLLDFVTQAVLNGSSRDQASLCATVDALLCKARSAQTVSLEEVEASCRKISQEAVKAKQGIKEVPESVAVVRLSDNIQRINEEADFAMMLVENARKELAKCLEWSCTKAKVKSDEWFGTWSQLLEQILSALGRARPPTAEAPKAGEAPVSALRDASLGGSLAHRRQSSVNRRQSNCGVPTNLVPGVKQGAPMAPPPAQPPAKLQRSTLDDEARAESLNPSSMQPALSKKPSLFAGFDDKENSCH